MSDIPTHPPSLKESEDIDTYYFLEHVQDLGGSTGFVKHVETEAATTDDKELGKHTTPQGIVYEVKVQITKLLGCFSMTITTGGEVYATRYKGYCVGFGRVPSSTELKGLLNVKDWALLLKNKLPTFVYEWDLSKDFVVVDFGTQALLNTGVSTQPVGPGGIKFKMPSLSFSTWWEENF